jgi:hypothetical protein
MDGEELILDLLKETRESVRTIEACIVGRDNCKSLMDDHDKRIRKIEIANATIEAVQDQSIDGEELLTAKNEAIRASDARWEALDVRLRSIESKLAVLDLTWDTVRNNPVLLAAFSGGATILGLVVFGRGIELSQIYGSYPVVLGMCVALIAFILAWISRRKVKKTLQHAGLINTLIILILISSCAAEDIGHDVIIDTGNGNDIVDPGDMTHISPTKPILNIDGIVRVGNSASNYKTAQENASWWSEISFFLSANSTNNTSLFRPDKIIPLSEMG